MKILILKTKAILPESKIYKEKLESIKKIENIKVDIVEAKDKNKCNLKEYNLIWNFMGIDLKKYRGDQFIIHDYRSASSGIFSKLKDKIKKYMNIKPNLRIFLNEELEKYYNFKDKIPSLIIDMGVNKRFYKNIKNKKKYKFIYVGEISKNRKMHIFLEWFIKSELKRESFLLIGPYDEKIYIKYSKYGNIKFLGKIPYEKIPKNLLQAEYAFNFIPNKFPYSSQTSTKLLEYLAIKIKVISSETEFLRKFLKDNPELKLFIFKKFDELKLDKIEKFDFKFCNMEKYKWENVIENKIEKILNLYLKDKN